MTPSGFLPADRTPHPQQHLLFSRQLAPHSSQRSYCALSNAENHGLPDSASPHHSHFNTRQVSKREPRFGTYMLQTLSKVFFLAPLVHLIRASETHLGTRSGEQFAPLPVYDHTTLNCITIKPRSKVVLPLQGGKDHHSHQGGPVLLRVCLLELKHGNVSFQLPCCHSLKYNPWSLQASPARLTW